MSPFDQTFFHWKRHFSVKNGKNICQKCFSNKTVFGNENLKNVELLCLAALLDVERGCSLPSSGSCIWAGAAWVRGNRHGAILRRCCLSK